MIRELIESAPRLCGLTGDEEKEVREDLMRKWDSEIARKEFQRQTGQSTRERLAPGFGWRDKVTGNGYLQVFDTIEDIAEFAGLSVDDNNNRITKEESVRLDELEEKLSELESNPIFREVFQIAPVDQVRVMDFWN